MNTKQKEQPKTAVQELEELGRALREHRASLKLQAARAKGPVPLELAEPILVNGEARTQLSVRPHTVKDLKLAEDEREGWTLRLSGMLTGLTPDEVSLLCMADWDAVQAVIEGFQMRRGVGSPARST